MPSVDLVTLDDLKVDLRLKVPSDGSDDTSWDNTLTRVISAVSQAIETYCRRTFGATTETSKKLDGDGTVMLLVRYPIISISSITNDTISVVETTNYEQYPKQGIIELTDGTVWANGRKKITITYRHGYEKDDIPSDIRLAASTWCIKKFMDIKHDRLGVTSRSKDGGDSVTFAASFASGGMPDEVKRLLSPYRVLFSNRWMT